MSLAVPASAPCTRGMAKSEPATQEWTLASVARGAVVDVVDVGQDDRGTFLVHGIRPGVRLAVEGDAPFGGPRLVRIGDRRLAIDRSLSRSIHVAPAVVSSPGVLTEPG